MNITKGYFYNELTRIRKDNDELKKCMESTVLKLKESETSLNKPGILLGKIQSGKTRAFIGIMALAFDNGYDIAIVLTKGTNALVKQTVERLKEQDGGFGMFEENHQIQIHDIMLFPDNLPRFVLSQKLIIVAKKEDDNLKKLIKTITVTYPDLKNKKILVVDDEADFASVSFYKEKETGNVNQGKISSLIDEIRNNASDLDFLQVTATPYSLYLQSNDNSDDSLFLPKRPSFTELLPIHNSYIGGDYYFVESDNSDSPASCVYEEISAEELDVLSPNKKSGRSDRRSFKIEEVFGNSKTKTLKKCIINFLVGGCIRRIQQRKNGKDEEYYSLVIHTDIHKVAHIWQEELIKRLNSELNRISQDDSILFNGLIEESYKDFEKSIELSGMIIPSFDDVLKEVLKCLSEEMLITQLVNSEKDVNELLDSKGQLKLWVPFNIFIGGQILDRGITIKNLIGFYYGRNPKRLQQDTVLQHSRMYGSRSREDLSVTRFYTVRNIYNCMKQINEFDSALRMAFENGSHDKGVYFIRRDENNKIVPCSPNKIMISSIETLKSHKRLLPIGFQTGYKTKIREDLDKLDEFVDNLLKAKEQFGNCILIDLDEAVYILNKINKMFVYEDDNKDYKWNIKSHISCLEYSSKNSANERMANKVALYVRKNRNLARVGEDGVYSHQPDNPSQDLSRAKSDAENIPALMLFRQSGDKELGWRDVSFWWPVILLSKNIKTAIFASDLNE